MNCALCLDSALDPSSYIDIKSDEGKFLDVKGTVEQHFWLKFDDTQSENNTNLICRNCWQYTSTFHEFYRRIEQAHNPLEELAVQIDCDVVVESKALPLIDPCEVNDIKRELTEQELNNEHEDVTIIEAAKEVVSIDIPASNVDQLSATKRRPGRPRKCSAKTGKTKQFEKREEDQTELHKDLEITIEPPVDSQRSNRKTLEENAILINTKEEPQGLKKSESSDSDNDNDNENDDTYSPPKIENCDSDAESEKETKPELKKKLLISRQFDDYIASNFKLSCSLCEVDLSDFSVLKVHFRSAHKMRGYVYCCKKKFLKRGVLVDHLRTHEDPEYFKCPTCAKVMADRRCLELHLKLHEGARERIFKCDICSKSFFKRTIFNRHMLMHVPADQRKEICSTCNKAFPTKYILTQHMRLVHLNTYTKICDVCGKAIRGREALKRHMEEHAGLPPQTIQCDLCGISLTTKYGLTRHMKAMHNEEERQPVVCKICSKMSPSMQAHKGHMKYMHNTERKHQCPMCSKAFKRPKELKEHMSTHTGEILYACPHCPKTFNSNANMHSHRKKMHRDEWEAKRQQRFKPKVRIHKIQNPKDQEVQVDMVVEDVKVIKHDILQMQPQQQTTTTTTNAIIS